MFCKNCGQPLNDNQAICLQCGVKVGEGNTFCANCGQPMNPGAAICLNCGVAAAPIAGPDSKKKMVALLLAIFLGSLGIFDFYMGYTTKGVIKLVVSLVLSVTFIGPIAMWVWALIDGIKAYKGELPDAKGNPLVD